MRSRICLLAALLLACLGTQAEANKDRPQTEDKIIFARDQALWVIEATGGDPLRLLDLPITAETVERIRVSSDGSALLVTGAGYVAWAALREEGETKLRVLPCSGPSNISTDGRRVVCGTQNAERIAIYTLAPKLGVEIIDRKALGPLAFAEAENEIISYGDNENVIAMSTGGLRVLAEHHPKSMMTVTPDGKRALGAYDEGAIDVVYTFRLDGKAIKRTLVHAARGIHISANSEWAAVQQEVDACAVRIAGGQYMCWRRFRALAISSQGRSLLLSRASSGKHELLLGSISGTSSRKPLPLLEGVAKTAAFWPQPGAQAPESAEP